MQSEVVEEFPQWRPFAAQVPFLESSAREALYGGAAGGGKTDSLVLGALRHVDHPKFTGIIFRRTFPELEGKVIPVTREWYPFAGGRYNGSTHVWTFPSGARIMLAHLQHEDDVQIYQGHEFQYIGFDELTHFTERQYTYLLSRLRSSAGIPLFVRAGTNPGGPGHEWVMKRWAPWLDTRPEYKGCRAEPGHVLRFNNTVHGEEWCDDGRFARVFFPSRATDNPHLNDDYTENLMGLDVVTREQLIHGNWLIKPAAGMYYQRGWFRWLDARPVGAICRVRRWDLASTEDGDWTIGCRMSLMRDRGVVIEDVVRKRLRPAGVEACVLATAELDGKDVHVVIPEDPGQAGKAQVSTYTKMLAGFVVSAIRETGDKVTRQGPFSAQCEAGNVSLVRGAWNEPFLQALEAFPDPAVHDDDIDAAAGAYTYLTSKLPNLSYLRAMENLAKESR